MPIYYWPLWRSVIGRDTFSVLAPVLDPLTKKLAMSPSSTVHGRQHDAKHVTFELLMHAAFVADEIWGFMLEPARNWSVWMWELHEWYRMVCINRTDCIELHNTNCIICIEWYWILTANFTNGMVWNRNCLSCFSLSMYRGCWRAYAMLCLYPVISVRWEVIALSTLLTALQCTVVSLS